jgi:hypothetical protein
VLVSIGCSVALRLAPRHHKRKERGCREFVAVANAVQHFCGTKAKSNDFVGANSRTAAVIDPQRRRQLAVTEPSPKASTRVVTSNPTRCLLAFTRLGPARWS